jgi:hypothetical protein
MGLSPLPRTHWGLYAATRSLAKCYAARSSIPYSSNARVLYYFFLMKQMLQVYFWKIILQFPNNIHIHVTCKISVLISTWTDCKKFVHGWIDFWNNNGYLFKFKDDILSIYDNVNLSQNRDSAIERSNLFFKKINDKQSYL